MKKLVSIYFLLIAAANTFAQVQDPASPGFDFNIPTDSATSAESTEENAEATAAVQAKPYERIVLNFDSVTNLITYTCVVEQEESSSDSLYFRARNFAIKYLSGGAKEKDAKQIFEIDKRNQKLVINAILPAYSYTNKYAKRPIGKYNFKMTVLIKEGRYKYTIANLVHESEKPNTGSPTRNYFEYYYTTNTNIKSVDQTLRYADKDINAMVESFKKALREPIQLDEDEW
jgi:hypothetical protein